MGQSNPTFRAIPHTPPPPAAQVAEASGAADPASNCPRRIATNFGALCFAELTCRAISIVVTLSLAAELGRAGYGRIEFAFNLVMWLVLLVREGVDVIATREIARHHRLIRPLVNHVLAVRVVVALSLLTALVGISSVAFQDRSEWQLLSLYGLMLLSTAIGLDFVYRGLERMGLLAVSLVLRTFGYAVGVAFLVRDPAQIHWVPLCLVGGELCGIALIWTCYVRAYGWPRPTLRGHRMLRSLWRRGRSIYLIQLSQSVIATADLVVVGLMSRWADVGLYGAPHRIAAAVLTLGILFRQAVFPALARSWRADRAESQRMIDGMVRVLAVGMTPLVVGVVGLSGPIVALILSDDYAGAGLLLGLDMLRVPLLTLAFLYQTMLIALNRESAGVRPLVVGALASGPLVMIFRSQVGLPGASLAVALIGLCLLVFGHMRLAREGRAPAWHYHLGRPLVGVVGMLATIRLTEGWGVAVAFPLSVAAYVVILVALGELSFARIRALFGSSPATLVRRTPPTGPHAAVSSAACRLEAAQGTP